MSFEISVVHGRTCRYTLDLTDQTGQPLDLESGTLTMAFLDPDSQTVEIVKETGDGLVTDDDVVGRAELTIDDSDTAALPNRWATLYGDATFFQDGEPFAALVGRLRIIPHVGEDVS